MEVGMTPASYNIIITQGASYSKNIAFKDSLGSYLNMNGYTVQAQVWTQGRRNLLANFTVTWLDKSQGKLTISLSSQLTSTIPSIGVWDLLVISPDGTKDYWMRGRTALAVGYTR